MVITQPFFIDLESTLHNAGDFPLIMGGDLNITPDSTLDHSGLAYNRPPQVGS